MSILLAVGPYTPVLEYFNSDTVHKNRRRHALVGNQSYVVYLSDPDPTKPSANEGFIQARCTSETLAMIELDWTMLL